MNNCNKRVVEGNQEANVTRMYLGIAIVVLALLLDILVFRPREPVLRTDRQILEHELESVIDATSASGKWWNTSVLAKGHSSLVVTGKYATPFFRERTMTTLQQALQNNGWRPLPASRTATWLCKNKYRVSLEPNDQTDIVSVSFTVKQFKKEPDCL